MEFKDEKVIPGGENYNSVEHTNTFDLPGNLDILKEFRSVLDAKTKEDESRPRYTHFKIVFHRNSIMLKRHF